MTRVRHIRPFPFLFRIYMKTIKAGVGRGVVVVVFPSVLPFVFPLGLFPSLSKNVHIINSRVSPVSILSPAFLLTTVSLLGLAQHGLSLDSSSVVRWVPQSQRRRIKDRKKGWGDGGEAFKAPHKIKS